MGKMRKIPLKERLRRTADPQGGFSKDMIPVAAWMYAFGYFIHLSEMSTDLCYVNFLERMECNAALYSRRKKHFIFDSINTITAPSFR